MNLTFHPLGEAALKCCFQEDVSPALTDKIQAFCRKLRSKEIIGITEWVPAYDSVAIYYDPWKLSYQQLADFLLNMVVELDVNRDESKMVTIPTHYGGDDGPDLENLAAANNLSTKDVINLHTSGSYLINMIGFLPGFPYLSGLDERIAMPRLENPRQSVPAGSVGIAESQTGIYPLDSPGGWHIIGRTPLKLFDAEKEEPFLFEQGDYLQFKAISEDEYKQIQREIENGTYKLERKEESE